MGATISECGKYRYNLTREWNSLFDTNQKKIVWVMLNPSTADANQSDPTLRRCIKFSQDWGFTHLELVNLYAFRSPYPEDLWTQDDPVGRLNDGHIFNAARTAHTIVCAWGGNAKPERARQIFNLLHSANDRVMCLGTNNDDTPKHPLYVHAKTELREYAMPVL